MSKAAANIIHARLEGLPMDPADTKHFEGLDDVHPEIDLTISSQVCFTSFTLYVFL
jgi:hypothetical protein